MRELILPEPDRMWLTTGDVARVLGLTPNGVRFLVRDRQLTCERAVSGQRLFRRADVRRCLIQRTEARARSRAAVLKALRPQMLWASLEPRQVSLFGPRIRIVKRGERPLQEGEVKRADLGVFPRGSDNCAYVDRKAAGGTR